jgi:hypothetical protein
MHQRRHAFDILCIDIGTVLNQIFHAVGIALQGGIDQLLIERRAGFDGGIDQGRNLFRRGHLDLDGLE